MRIDTRRVWQCLIWTGPNGEVGNGLWLRSEEAGYDAAWCSHLDERYPGWIHTILEHRGMPGNRSPQGWEAHPYFGDMQFAPVSF